MQRSSAVPPSRKKTKITAFNDYIPVDADYGNILHREGRVLTGHESAATTRRSVLVDDTQWTSTRSWSPTDDTEYGLDSPESNVYQEALDRDVADVGEAPAVARKTYARSKVSRRPHVVWMEVHRQTYLEEMLRLEGRGDFYGVQVCPDCLAKKAISPGHAAIRCKDCLTPDLVCSSCCVRRHRTNPFHRIEKWEGTRFIAITLRSIGAFIQLNHAGTRCGFPVNAHKGMLVLHTNGIHDVDVKYCGCDRAIPNHLQLLRKGLYPASQITIRTCASFELLRLLHMLALTTKSNTYDFYRALEKLTVNTGVGVPKSRYRALMRMVLQWRHLKMLKRAGRGNDPTGVSGTTPGELAVMCPLCPRPDINLEADWASAPLSMKFLYMAFLCMDANFRLKNQLVSNYSQDPGLGIGWAYLVPRHAYGQYVLQRAKDGDISTCVGFQALAKANTKFSQGLRYTGVGMVSCGRSKMVLPVGVGNLQKGERYANMDYIYGSALAHILVPLILISYDICCQWFVNLFKRVDEHWPQPIRPDPKVKMIPAIPKMHEPAHGKANHEKFSLNFIPGVGHSDLEGPERIWSAHNALGNSTKTQGPGSRQDVLDDHFGFWNWLKYSTMGDTLMRRYRAAVLERNIQTEAHRGLTSSVHDPGMIERWESMCLKWEQAPFPKTGIPNPYALSGIALTETQVRHQLHLDESKRLDDGGEALHPTSPAAFIMMGLDLEDSQRRIRMLAKRASSSLTSKKSSDLAQARNQLRTRIRSWEQVVPIYLPGLAQFQHELETGDVPPTSSLSTEPKPSLVPISAHPEDAILWLPSTIPTYARRRVCREGLPKLEEKLRDVQLADSLETIRHILRVKARMVAFKNKNHRGQHEGTRSRTYIDRVHDKALSAAEKYRAARKCKLYLAANSDWEARFLPLANSDIRGYQDPNKLKPRVGRRGTREDDHAAREDAGEDDPEDAESLELAPEERTRRDGTGETRRTLSWIWTVEGVHNEDQDENSDDILRAEWCKSRARAERAKEEVLLLKEEMRRTLRFLEWRANWWRSRPQKWDGIGIVLEEGHRAYAKDQAAIQEALLLKFRTLWDTPLSLYDTQTSAAPGPAASSSSDILMTDVNAVDNDDDDDDDDDDIDDDDERDRLFDDDEVVDDEREVMDE